MRRRRTVKPAQKRSVFRQWMVSSLLILLIPLLGATAASTYTHRAITAEIAKNNQMTLHSLLRGIDDSMAQMERVMTSIIVDERVIDLLRTERADAVFLSHVADVVKFLYTLQFPFEGMEIALYLPAQDYLITASTANLLSALHAALVYQNQTNQTLDIFQTTLRARYKANTYHLMDNPLYTLHGRPCVLYARTISSAFTQHTRTGATIFVTIPIEQIAGTFAQDTGTRFLILDATGAIRHVVPPVAGSLPALPEASDEAVRVVNVNGTDYIFSSIHSERSGFSFALLAPERTFWAGATYAATITAITLLAAALIGLFSAFVSLRLNYRPVQTLLESLPLSAATPGGNEFDIIQDAFEQLRRAHQGALGKLSTQQEIFRENYLLSRLHGNRSPLSDADMEAALQLSFHDKRFALIGVLTNPEERPNTDAWLLEAPQKQDPVQYAIHHVFLDALMGYRVYPLVEDSLLAYLFVLTDEQAAAFERTMHPRMQACMEQVQSMYGLSFSFILSDVIDDFDGLHRLYRDMFDMAQYQYVTRYEGIVQLDALRRVPAGAPDLEENEKVLLLCDAVLAGRAQDAESILVLLLQALDASASSPFYLSRFRIFGWWRTILSICHERASAQELKRLTQGLIACEDMGALVEQSRRLLRALCGEAQTREDRLSDRVVRHVQEQYQDVNLSLGSIAGAMALSPKYLSRLFRAEAGFGLLDYITTVRVQHAKKLLAQGKHTVQEIAEMVGYSNTKTFRRAFLKVEGINPGEYQGRDDM